MAVGFAGFPPETLKFLKQLKRNNDRDWFLAHKEIFEENVKGPMVELVTSLGGAMQSFAPELVVDPKKAIYRIYRDIRFSSDKTPYKTHMAAIFAPRGMEKNASSVIYFHFSPEEIIIAGGVYMPGSKELLAIRQHVAAQSARFRGILKNREFKKTFGEMYDERLARAPKGFPPDHEAIDLLKYKHYMVSISEAPKLVESPKLFPRLLTTFALMMPFVRFLNEPLKTYR
jgi:uncharacterized protein (TIGR02453 family)